MVRHVIYSPAKLTELLGFRSEEISTLDLNDPEVRAMLSAIVDDLHIIVGTKNAARWIRTANDSLCGSSALEIILHESGGLKRIQRYVKAVAMFPW